MKLSDNFDLEEFTDSPTARKLRIDNTPDGEAIFNLQELVTNLLQPLRERYGKPIAINSGYRCPALNEAVGGVPSSQHQRGMAADCRAEDPKKLLALLRSSGLSFDQAGLYRNFLHLSYKPHGRGNRMMVFQGKY